MNCPMSRCAGCNRTKFDDGKNRVIKICPKTFFFCPKTVFFYPAAFGCRVTSKLNWRVHPAACWKWQKNGESILQHAAPGYWQLGHASLGKSRQA